MFSVRLGNIAYNSRGGWDSGDLLRDISRRTDWLSGLAKASRDREIQFAPGERSIPAHTDVPVDFGDPQSPTISLPVIPSLPGVRPVVVRRDPGGSIRGEIPETPVVTDWGEVYREFEELNPDETGHATIPITEPGEWIPDTYEPAYPGQPQTEETPVAMDWGDFAQGAIQGVISGLLPGQTGATPPFSGTPPALTPTKVTVDTRTGAVTKCSRRRRRRLLTPTDLSDLAALQALVGKGSSALNMAVAKAVRR